MVAPSDGSFKRFRAQKAEAEKHQTETKIRERNDYRVAQTKLLLEKVPELSDAQKSSPRLRRARLSFEGLWFRGRGACRDWREPFSDNANFQRLVLDAMAFRDGQKAKAQVLESIASAVLRPGAPEGTESAGIQSSKSRSSNRNSTGVGSASRSYGAGNHQARTSGRPPLVI